MKLIPEKDCSELQRHPISGVWYWRKFVAGRGEFFRSTRERKSKAKAKAIGLKMFAEWLGTPEAIRAAEILFDDFADKVLELKAGKAPRTRRSAEDHIEMHLRPFFSGYEIARIDEELWERYVIDAREKHPGRKLFNDRKQLITIMRLAYSKRAIDRLPKFRNPDPTDQVGKEYTEAEIERLLENAGPDLNLQIQMGYKNGMRRREICVSRYDWFDLNGGFVRIPREITKIRRTRVVPVHPDVLELIRERARGASSPYLFPSPADSNKPVQDNTTAWDRCREKAKVEGRFHDLVHTFMSWGLYKYGIPLAHLCAIAGKSVAVAEKRYLHARPSSLKEALTGFQTKKVGRGNSGSKGNDKKKHSKK